MNPLGLTARIAFSIGSLVALFITLAIGVQRKRSTARNGLAPKESQGRAYQGKIDQVVAVRSRKRPSPSAQSIVIPPDRLLYVRGWAVGSTSFELAIDNHIRIPCVTGLARPDIEAFLGSPLGASAGFEAFLELPALSKSSSHLVLSAVEGPRTKTLDTRSIRIGDPLPRTTLRPVPGGLLNVDRIQVGSRSLEPRARGLVVGPSDLVTIEGWAIDEADRRAGIALYALVDDREALPLAYGFERNDLVDAFGTSDARLSGFRATIDPAPYTQGSHIIRIVILMDDGSALACADTFALLIDA